MEWLSALFDITWRGEGSLGKASGGYELCYKLVYGVVKPLSRAFETEYRTVSLFHEYVTSRSAPFGFLTLLVFCLQPCGLSECGAMEVGRGGLQRT